jgi:hypothetical protein
MGDVAKVPVASPPKPKRLSSNFEAYCGLIRESSSTYNSFPEFNHVLAAFKSEASTCDELRSKFSDFDQVA